MKRIDELCEADSEIHNIFVESMPLLRSTLHTHKFPLTAQSLFLFILKTNFIKEGIFELVKSENLYSLNILYRSLLEHFLRFQFIFFKLGLDKNDKIGEDFIRFCSYSENIDTGRAWKEVAKIIESTNSSKDPFELLKEITPGLKNISKQEIINKATQFQYKNIIRFLHGVLINRKSDAVISFLLKIIPEYSDLSSFVHGGPHSDLIMLDKLPQSERDSEFIRKAEFSFSIAAQIKNLTFMALASEDRRLKQFQTRIDNILKYNIR